MAAASVCVKCHDPLVVEIESDQQDHTDAHGERGPSSMLISNTVPDDVALACGDHWHWDCLMEADSYELDTCPACTQKVGSGDKVLVDYHNEGGLQKSLDILPMLREEAYLRAYPNERKCRAFIELCKEGDHRAVADLLVSCDGGDDDDEEEDGSETEMTDEHSPLPPTIDEILRYQDPIADMQSGLHAAVANGSREVAWLLLLLASELPEMEFPALVYQEAATLGVMRSDQTGKTDIRGLRDAHGKTAEDLAKEAGVIWHGWIGNGRLSLDDH